MTEKAKLEMRSIKSSNLKNCGHCPESNDLHVEFARGKAYVYSNVPAQTVANLRAASSPGAYLRKYIIGKFPTRRL